MVLVVLSFSLYYGLNYQRGIWYWNYSAEAMRLGNTI